MSNWCFRNHLKTAAVHHFCSLQKLLSEAATSNVTHCNSCKTNEVEWKKQRFLYCSIEKWIRYRFYCLRTSRLIWTFVDNDDDDNDDDGINNNDGGNDDHDDNEDDNDDDDNDNDGNNVPREILASSKNTFFSNKNNLLKRKIAVDQLVNGDLLDWNEMPKYVNWPLFMLSPLLAKQLCCKGPSWTGFGCCPGPSFSGQLKT